MLPRDILDIICSHLNLEDIAALSKSSPEWENVILERTYRDAVLRHCPYFDLKYSQWDSWKASALNLGKMDMYPFSMGLDCSVRHNVPLPDDFQVLCPGVDLNSDIVYENDGIFIQRSFVSLKRTRKEPPELPEFMEVDSVPYMIDHDIFYGDEHMHVVGEFHRAVCTPQIMAAVTSYDDEICLMMRDLTEPNCGPQLSPMYYAGLPGKVPFRLQAVGKKVILVVTGPTKQLQSSIFSAADGFTRLEHTQPLKTLPAGMVLYDGHVFDVSMTSDKNPSAQSTQSKYSRPIEWDLNRYHKVEQDRTHTQYALIYNQYGVVAAVVDLKQHKMVNLRPHYTQHSDSDRLVVVVGLSKGSLGVWKYTRDYIAKEYEDQLEEPMHGFMDLFQFTEERPQYPAMTFKSMEAMAQRYAYNATIGGAGWD
ncbi:hypothetical protein CJU90_5863 [Yarrowia sp. C11]|nr:hypothetical protein CJU90_5863 [Yarrowia sp. C11]KAG5364437.1 hypothetical protein CKK34_3241 [Yarrowia sp. E02]